MSIDQKGEKNMSAEKKFIVIAGPCVAESMEILEKTLIPLQHLVEKELQGRFFFKSSFDKANRTSIKSYRGPGWSQAKEWFLELKQKHGCSILTDIHETHQAELVAPVCEGLQIPAFLCRQTDLLLAAAQTGRFVNVKKGQFMAPTAMAKAVEKIGHSNMALTERGNSFGYGDLVVDMRSFPMMKAQAPHIPLIFDVTHSVQKPATGEDTSSGARMFAPVLARAALATGSCDGIFLEVHPNPGVAKSDASLQLSIPQALSLIRDLHRLWLLASAWGDGDRMLFPST